MEYIGQNRIRVPEKGRMDWDVPLNRNWQLISVFEDMVGLGASRVVSGCPATTSNQDVTVGDGVVVIDGGEIVVTGDTVTCADGLDTWIYTDATGVIQSSTDLPPSGAVPLYMAPVEGGVISYLSDLRVFPDAVASTLGGNRNLIINGDFRVNQRTGHGVETTTNYAYSADRAFSAVNKTGASVARSSRLTGTGDKHYLLMRNVAAVAGFTTNEYVLPYIYRMEVGDILPLQHSPCALSFDFNANTTGVYSVVVCAAANSTFYTCPFTITVTTANVFQRYSVTVPALGVAYTEDLNEQGLMLYIGGVGGPDIQATGSSGGWTEELKYTTSDAVNWCVAANNQILLTNIQMEVGSQATPFKYRTYAEELALCQRYYVSSSSRVYTFVNGTSSNLRRANVMFPVAMRAAPSVSGLFTGDITANISTIAETHFLAYLDVGNTTSTTDFISYTADAEL
jgi:hypothetical protein